MKYFVIAGEPSGDLHGSKLMRGIIAEDSEAEFRFWGGDAMAEVGGRSSLLKHYSQSSFFGVVEVVRNLRTILSQVEECKRSILEFQPDVVILVDYPGFNMKIARFAKLNSIKVFYYIAPKVWASRQGRIKAMKRDIDELFVIFPFEKSYFAQRGIEAHYFGNPLLDEIERKVAALPSREEFVERNRLDERPIIALLSGSRRSEIRANLPLMVEASRAFEGYQFVVGGVSWLDRAEYEKCLEGSSVRLVVDQTYELLTSAEAAVVTSGTATLETALLNIPEVVVYRAGALLYTLRPLLIHTKHISLVNINLEREAVREVVQVSMDSRHLVESLARVVKGGADRERVLADYAQLREIMGKSGSSERAAKRMVELLGK